MTRFHLPRAPTDRNARLLKTGSAIPAHGTHEHGPLYPRVQFIRLVLIFMISEGSHATAGRVGGGGILSTRIIFTI